MTTIDFSERERYALFVIFSQEDWGGSEAALLARDDAYQALDLAAFETAPAVAPSDAPALFTLAPPLVDYLCAALPRPGQSRELGRISARLLRRLRAAARDSAGPPGVDRPAVNGTLSGGAGDPVEVAS